jgi:hypothetical protein
LYGGVEAERAAAGNPADDESSAAAARFLFAVDSLGLAAVLPIASIEYEWSDGAPAGMRIAASRGDDRLELHADVRHVQSSRRDPRSPRGDIFFQMRGQASVAGQIGGGQVDASGSGFFETWRRDRDASADGDPNPGAGRDR